MHVLKTREAALTAAAKQSANATLLQHAVPELAQEWDYGKNETGPVDYTAGSEAIAWWQTASRGSWQQSIDQRMQNRKRQQQRTARKHGL